MFGKERRQRLFWATQIRKQVQAEENREELDISHLAFIALPGAGGRSD